MNIYDKMPTGTRDNQTQEEREWIQNFMKEEMQFSNHDKEQFAEMLIFQKQATEYFKKSDETPDMLIKSARMLTVEFVREIKPNVKCQSCEDTGEWKFYVDIDSDEIGEIPCLDCNPMTK